MSATYWVSSLSQLTESRPSKKISFDYATIHCAPSPHQPTTVISFLNRGHVARYLDKWSNESSSQLAVAITVLDVAGAAARGHRNVTAALKRDTERCVKTVLPTRQLHPDRRNSSRVEGIAAKPFSSGCHFTTRAHTSPGRRRAFALARAHAHTAHIDRHKNIGEPW